ncbi:hypothetical protein [Faecalibacterium sp. An121]|uniref:hypothetical protein n=1 Tax=Faecalibacterium sp. An121 TaxID=1965550 RepID=UPI000B3AEC00|nr:hypothetical protein [Faecalibacterium sp. An121]OUQ35512.1 hypothetical protein B5E66_11425 [Faecalibacterium sp. An121]
MKLKKIASLALAGIMAVSMLAGCNGSSSSTPTEPETPATSNYAATLQDALEGDARRIVTEAVANSELDSALQSAVDTYYNDLQLRYANDTDVEFLKYDKAAGGDINSAVVKALSAEDTIEALDNNNDKDTVAVEVYAVSASVSNTKALELVADKITNTISGNVNNGKFTEKSSNGEYDYSYDIAASIVTKNYSTVGDMSVGVKYIAIAVTQHVTRV